MINLCIKHKKYTQNKEGQEENQLLLAAGAAGSQENANLLLVYVQPPSFSITTHQW